MCAIWMARSSLLSVVVLENDNERWRLACRQPPFAIGGKGPCGLTSRAFVSGPRTVSIVSPFSRVTTISQLSPTTLPQRTRTQFAPAPVLFRFRGMRILLAL